MKRIALGVLLLAVAGVVAWCWPRAISPANYRKVRAGMNRQQVEALIGLPPGIYYVGPEGCGSLSSQGAYGHTMECRGLPEDAIPEEWFDRFKERDPQAEAATVLRWWGNRYAIDVAFDESGAAASWSLIDVSLAIEPTVAQRVRMFFSP